MRKLLPAIFVLCGMGVPALAQVATYDSGAISVPGAGTAGSHAGGVSAGGLFSVPIARGKGGSGIITNFMLTDISGTVGAFLVRVWQAKPVNTACADGSAFVSNSADDSQLITPPFSVTPALPAVTTGDSKTYASSVGLTWDYRNNDYIGTGGNNTYPSQNAYVCLVVASAEALTPANLSVMLSGPQNN